MVSIHAQSKTCFVFPDGEGGWVVKMTMPNGQPLEFPLDLRRAAELQAGVATALADLAKKAAPAAPG